MKIDLDDTIVCAAIGAAAGYFLLKHPKDAELILKTILKALIPKEDKEVMCSEKKVSSSSS